nr:MAG TPA: hypothetical protein [Caudoviricetes sp.]
MSIDCYRIVKPLFICVFLLYIAIENHSFSLFWCHAWCHRRKKCG